MLLQRFRATSDFIANLQDRVGSGSRIIEHITRKNDTLAWIFRVSLFVQLTNYFFFFSFVCKALHRRCIEKLYNDDPELDDLLESQNTGAALSILLSRLNRRVENLSEARLCLDKILSPLIAENYYRSLDHHGPSFKQLDAKRMGQKGSFTFQSARQNSTTCN